MQLAPLVAIDGDFGNPAAQYGCLAGANDVYAVYFAGFYPILDHVANGIGVFLDKVRRSFEGFTRRIVKLFPLILTTHYQIGNEHTRNGTMSHAIAGIAGSDKHIIFIHRIPPDKGQTIYWLHYLT